MRGNMARTAAWNCAVDLHDLSPFLQIIPRVAFLFIFHSFSRIRKMVTRKILVIETTL
jgi:hypothetical protein